MALVTRFLCGWAVVSERLERTDAAS